MVIIGIIVICFDSPSSGAGAGGRLRAIHASQAMIRYSQQLKAAAVSVLEYRTDP
jgi:hypothetical protein